MINGIVKFNWVYIIIAMLHWLHHFECWCYLYTCPASGFPPEDTGGPCAACGGCIGYFICWPWPYAGPWAYAGPQYPPGGGCVVGVISGRILLGQRFSVEMVLGLYTSWAGWTCTDSNGLPAVVSIQFQSYCRMLTLCFEVESGITGFQISRAESLNKQGKKNSQ